MASYKFEYFKGQSKPSKTIEAKDDAHAYRQIEEFLKQEQSSLVKGSIVMSKTETRNIPDPPPHFNVKAA